MKLQLCTMIILAVCVTSFAMADTIILHPSDLDLYDLDHSQYYTWGINYQQIDSDEVDASNIVIFEAKLFFDNIRNWDNTSNDLWINLLDKKRYGGSIANGVQVYTDNSSSGNAFSLWQGILLHHYVNLPATSQDITYTFDENELQTLNDYLHNDGNFALGFDPDCHFYNDGIYLTLSWETQEVPEPASLGLLGIGLVFLRRRRK